MKGRIIFWLVAIGALAFAVQGGEYSTLDLWRQRQLKEKLQGQTDSLERHVDSLKIEAQALMTDRATQERVAREKFGMVRGQKEILYRLGNAPDTAARP